MIAYARLKAFLEAVKSLREAMGDSEALDNTNIYPMWKADTDYQIGDRVIYNNVLYKVLQAHRSQADWTPDVAVSLFAEVLIPDPEVIPEWVQPDSTNPYMTGDKVTHGGKTWESDIDNNVWEPGVYGWSEI